VSNVLAIAQKELKAYFASPIGYIVIAVFALLMGFFFSAILEIYVQQSIQMGQFGGAPQMNVNDQVIRPLMLNGSVMVLFVLPMITMRTYSEEKRSGTIELLLTSPLTDFQIVMGKFVGAMSLYAAMLLVTVVDMALLFAWGNPEWAPVVGSYLGLLLMGGCFVAIGLFVSSTTKNQVVAAVVTWAIFLMLWVIDWISQSLQPPAQDVVQYLSFTNHFDDFSRGIIDTKHLVYYVSFIAFGLFLTMRSVDTERWRG
jgi:ABC-2 type transport system permease protein